MIEKIKEITLDILDKKQLISPVDIEKIICSTLSISKKAVRSSIRELVQEGRISYANDFGHTFLIQSIDRPFRVSPHVILKPVQIATSSLPQDIVITIESGASFGNGAHPTTRLAIQAIDYLITDALFFKYQENPVALDIGIGSGILAITALKMGISKAVGMDIDPCARVEAEKNAKHNGVENRLMIHIGDLNELDAQFQLVLANLRFPTLLSLCSELTKILSPNSAVVVSGIKSDEKNELVSRYHQHQLNCIWEKLEKDWVGMIFVKQ